jgi:hypothetical protein
MSVEFKIREPDIGEAKAANTITHASADTNQAGADHDCVRAMVKAFTTNTGLVWVDFGTAAVDGACLPLDAGESVSVPVTNTNKINCLFKVGGEKVAVVYSN